MRPSCSVWIFTLLASSALLRAAQPAGVIYYSAYDPAAEAQRHTLRAMNPDGTGDRLVVTALPEPGFPTWSRDGKLLSLTSIAPGKEFGLSRDVFVGPGPLGPFTQITAYKDDWNFTTNDIGERWMNNASYGLPFYKAFAPDGRSIAIADYEVSHSSASRVIGFPDFESLSAADYATPTLKIYSLNGTMLAFVDVARADGITIHAGDGLDWAPNADKIAWSRDVNKLSPLGAVLPVTALFIYDPVADAKTLGRARQLTQPNLDDGYTWTGAYILWDMDYAPAFSPDGSQVAYVRASELMLDLQLPSLTASICIINTDGTGNHEVIKFPAGQCISKLAWSPDGTRIAFDRGPMAVSAIGYPLLLPQFDKVAIYTMRTDGTGVAQVRAAPAFWPVWVAGGNQAAPELAPKLARLADGKPQIQLAWPAADQDCVLEEAQEVADPGAWKPVPITPALVGETLTVTLDAPAACWFYRLRR